VGVCVAHAPFFPNVFAHKELSVFHEVLKKVPFKVVAKYYLYIIHLPY
jgi:hypothetical protein